MNVQFVIVLCILSGSLSVALWSLQSAHQLCGTVSLNNFYTLPFLLIGGIAICDRILVACRSLGFKIESD